MNVDALRQEGYDLLHDGLIELSQVEATGIRIDGPRLQSTKRDLENRVAAIRRDLIGTEVGRIWKRRFSDKTNLGSRDQFCEIFYGQLKFKPVKMTDSGAEAADEDALIQIDHPFIEPYLKMSGYEKALKTFIHGIESETVNGRLHPSFMLHTVRTFRSSSSDPNFQNFPVRDKEIAQIIRSLFIPSEDCVLVENDFKGIEVSISACYHQDQNFISYITTPGKDMHGDMAAQLFKLNRSEVSKEARHIAKNSFVFPQFYGDFWGACAKYMWKAMDLNKVMVGPKDDLRPLREHLENVGFLELGSYDDENMEPDKGTFMAHVKEVQEDFWGNRFKDYGQWRKDFYNQYLERGYFDIYTGFRVSGVIRRNAVCNYPIQGSAFHCLLWTLIQVNREIRRRRMKSRVVGQIHDSLIGDVPVDELREYLMIVEETATKKTREYYKWLTVPLEIEYEICPIGASWFDKKETKFKQGQFKHPDNEAWTTNARLFLDAIAQRQS